MIEAAAPHHSDMDRGAQRNASRTHTTTDMRGVDGVLRLVGAKTHDGPRSYTHTRNKDDDLRVLPMHVRREGRPR